MSERLATGWHLRGAGVLKSGKQQEAPDLLLILLAAARPLAPFHLPKGKDSLES